MRRKLKLLAALLLLIGAGAITWTLLGWPPPGLVLKYGIPPYCAPTGETMNVEGIEFVEVGPGCFRMGSHYWCEEGDLLGRAGAFIGLEWGTPPDHDSNQCPVHWVEFENGFWIARTEVTNKQYERFAPNRERSYSSRGDGHPVMCISWEEAREYCDRLSAQSGFAVRLPSEAEWECAARAGSEAEYSFGEDWARLEEYAWYSENAGNCAHEVGTRRANSWGIFDLYGNVSEWCEDNWHDTYLGAPTDGRAWISRGSLYRVYRGGSWRVREGSCCSAYRQPYPASTQSMDSGFRPALTLPAE